MNHTTTKFGILTGLSLFALSCDPKATMTTKLLTSQKGSATPTGQLALTLEVVDDIELALVEKGGLTIKEAETIKQGALSGLNNQTQSLALAGEELTLDQTLPLVVQGALTAMKEENAGLSDGGKKVDVSAIVLGTTISSMGQKSTDLGSELRQKVPTAVVASGVSYLDEGGVEASFMGKAVGGISGAGISSMDDGKFGTEDYSVLVETMTEGAVKSIKNTGSKKGQMISVLKEMLTSSVKNLDNGGIDKASIAEFTGKLTQTTMKNIKTTGLESVAEIKSASGSVMAGAMLGVKDAGLDSDEDIAKALDKSLAGAIGGASKAGVASEKIHLVMDQAVKNAVVVLPDIGITSANSLKTMAVSAAQSAINQFSEVGIKNDEAARVAASSVALGAMAAVGQFKTKGLIDGNGTAAISNSVASAGVKTLFEQAKKAGYSGSMTQVSNQFTTGMVNGLAEAGLPASEIRTTTAQLKESVKEGFRETNALSEAEIESLASQASFAAETWVNDMKKHCESAKGIWDAAREVCNFPQDEPVAGASLPSAEEEDTCYSQGGEILFHGDGSWFCAFPQGEGLADRASCQAAGYQWALGPDGAYCETFPLPSSCWLAFGPAGCQEQGAGCSWTGSYCEAREFLTCDSFDSALACGSDASCRWDRYAGVCEKDICGVDPSATGCQAPDGSGLVIVGKSPNSLSLEWAGNPNAYGYVIHYQEGVVPSSCQSSGNQLAVFTEPYYTIDYLSPGITYGIRVCAVKDASGSQPSPGLTILARTDDGTATAITLMTSYVTSPSAGMQISWDDLGVDGYLLVANESNPVSWVPTDGTSYVVGGLVASHVAIYVGPNLTAVHVGATAGSTFDYALYSYDSNLNYSPVPISYSPPPGPDCGSLAGGTWIPVFGDFDYEPMDFCVMKYEAKNVSGILESTAPNTPWVSISQTDSITQCSSLGTSYHLISNPEWMTIAVGIANVADNWSGGTMGSGSLNQGHTDSSPANSLSADTDDNNACSGTGQTCDASTWDSQRRTHNLSSPEVIWDIGGNVKEWVDYFDDSGKPNPGTASWYEYSAVSDGTTTTKDMLVPINANQSYWDDSWGYTEGIGQFYASPNSSGGALLRGGAWNTSTQAGVFTATLVSAPTDTNTSIGFRCAYIPSPPL